MKLSIKEYAAKKGISEQAVYKQINHGRIKEEYLTRENGKTYIDDAALELADAPKEEKKDERERYIEKLETELAELREEVKAQRDAQAKQQERILSLMEQQIKIQENFQFLLAQQQHFLQAPQATATEAESEEPATVETVEKVEEEFNQKVEKTNGKTRRKWLFFGRRGG